MSVATVPAMDAQWEALADMARGLLDEQDRQRWLLGEIVDTVETHYDDNSIIKFCEEVKANPKTMYQYRAVYRFYPKDVWREYPMVRYTQWRDAMRLKDVNAALDLLARFNDKNTRMIEFYNELERLQGKKSTVVEKVFDKVTEVRRRGDAVIFICDAIIDPSARYRVVVYEV